MADNSQSKPYGFSPAHYGIASVIAACLAWGSLYVIFNQGPDGAFNNQLSTFAIYLLLLIGVVCGVLGVGVGIHQKQWLGIITGAIGLAIAGLGARIVMGF